MTSYLVTGHRGFIGSHIYDALPANKIGVDLKEGEDILEQLPETEVDIVFHLAALPRVEYSVKNPSYTLKHNVLGTSRLLEWAKNHGAKRVVFSSSSAVYGEGNGPVSPYGLHKLMGEMECRLYSQLYDLDTVSLRYFNAYAEDQPFGGAYSTVISAWMEMIRTGRPLRLDGDGEQTRDYVHVDDIVSANLFCAGYKGRFNGATYDIGSGKTVSLNQIKDFINGVKEVEWASSPPRPGDGKHTEANIGPIFDLGWSAEVDILDGLARCFK